LDEIGRQKEVVHNVLRMKSLRYAQSKVI